MRHPDRRQAEIVGEDVVRQRAAEIGQDRRRLAGGLRRSRRRPSAPRDGRGRAGSPGNTPSSSARSRTIGKPCASRWRRSAGRKFSGSTPTTKRIWQVALACGGIALTGFSGLPVVKASTSKLHQPNTFSAGAEARLAPVRIDLRRILAALDGAIGERHAHRVRADGVGTHSRTRIAPFGVGDRRQRMRQDHAGVGEQPAPIAGMMAALAQVDDQVEIHRAARAEEDRRPLRREARPVRGDQHIGGEPVLVLRGRPRAGPGEPISSPVSIRNSS